MKKAIILLSGGLDSATTLYYAINNGYQCFALTFDYGQRHRKEINAAKYIAKKAKVSQTILEIKLPWKGSALLDKKIKVPQKRAKELLSSEIPITYVPARNTIFLSFALSYAEAMSADSIFIGANAIDYSGYPDCRPDFIHAMEKAGRLGTKHGKIRILAPLIKLSKTKIIALAKRLKVPIEKTWSCYLGGETPCGECDSCIIRNSA